MALFTIENLTFSYPGEAPCLKNIDCSIEEGELILLLGDSGSGKTTLLKHLKPQLTPFGKREGMICFDGREISTGTVKQGAVEIGYVFQNPADQIVTDKVWHELAFGLENLGLSQREMERRIAEVVSYFGMEEWLYRDTNSLSGGQLQQLNLAAVLCMQPRVILLDEPTSQLDPIAAKNFLFLVKQLKEELGMTVLLSEHRNDIVYPMVDKVAYLRQGELLFFGDRNEAVRTLSNIAPAALPTVTRIYANIEVPPYERPPFDLAGGRRWLEGKLAARAADESETAFTTRETNIEKDMKKKTLLSRRAKTEGIRGESRKHKIAKGELAISIKELYFRYEKHGRDIVRELSLSIKKGECFGIMGGNGSGKSTILRLLAGLERPYAGKIKLTGKTLYLSQNPQNHFTKEQVAEELALVDSDRIEAFGLADLKQQHPYDLSGGEQQRLALLKVLGQEGELLLLDEPAKGLDEKNQNMLGQLIRTICVSGKTVVVVTHDVSFAARYCDRVGMLFDGRVTGTSDVREFFLHNQFYTTVTRRLTKGLLPSKLFPEEVKLGE